MDKRKNWIVSLFVILFTVSISVVVIPCGIANTHGLFGEITASTVTEDKEREIENIKSQYRITIQAIKGINIFNIWFELMGFVICICCIAYLLKLPREDTIVTLKVRMDD